MDLNKEPPRHNAFFMDLNEEPPRHSSFLMYLNEEPPRHSAFFMDLNEKPPSYSSVFMDLNEEPPRHSSFFLVWTRNHPGIAHLHGLERGTIGPMFIQVWLKRDTLKGHSSLLKQIPEIFHPYIITNIHDVREYTWCKGWWELWFPINSCLSSVWRRPMALCSSWIIRRVSEFIPDIL